MIISYIILYICNVYIHIDIYNDWLRKWKWCLRVKTEKTTAKMCMLIVRNDKLVHVHKKQQWYIIWIWIKNYD